MDIRISYPLSTIPVAPKDRRISARSFALFVFSLRHLPTIWTQMYAVPI
ncbi:hypothetical protein [Paenibacillus campi]|nr:hypothetical protein [Paenibacillus sp. SGZ-1009]